MYFRDSSFGTLTRYAIKNDSCRKSFQILNEY